MKLMAIRDEHGQPCCPQCDISLLGGTVKRVPLLRHRGAWLLRWRWWSIGSCFYCRRMYLIRERRRRAAVG